MLSFIRRVLACSIMRIIMVIGRSLLSVIPATVTTEMTRTRKEELVSVQFRVAFGDWDLRFTTYAWGQSLSLSRRSVITPITDQDFSSTATTQKEINQLPLDV